jgi:endonuclease-3
MKTNKISDYLDYLFPNPKCELIYNNDYELLIAIVLSAQSTDKRVNSVTPIIFNKYKSLKELKEADLSDLESIIRPVGSFRKKASYIKNIAMILDDEYDGVVPTDRDKLIKFPGVGRKTSNVFLSEFYNYPAIAVDTHVERVSKRLKLAYKNDDVFTIEKKLMRKFPKDIWARLHLQLVLFGRYYCKAVKPECENCRLKDICIEKNKRVS